MAVLSRFLRPRPSIPTSIFSSMAYRASFSTDRCIPAGSASVTATNGSDEEGEKRKIHWVFLGCPGVGKGTYASRLSRLLGVPHIATGDLVRHELSSSGPLASKLAEIVKHGKLVPDEIIFDLLSKHLEDGQSKGVSGFILDGFPRTVRQAHPVWSLHKLMKIVTAGFHDQSADLLQPIFTLTAITNSYAKHHQLEHVAFQENRSRLFRKEILDGVVDIDLVINLKLREEALIAKCLGRRICSKCGGNFNVASIDLKNDNGGPALYMSPLLPPPECESKLITRTDDEEEVVKKRLQIYHETTEPVEEFYRRQGKLLQFDLPGGIPESWPKLLHLLNVDDLDHEQSAAA